MFSLLWIPATLAAAGLQVARNALQRGLLPTSGPWAATLVRFLFGLPFAVVFTAAAWMVSPDARLHMGLGFWWPAMSGALAQVLATACVLVSMRRAGFGVATAMQQSALPLAAVVGFLLFHDNLRPLAWAGVALTSAGLLALTWPRQASGPQPVSGGVYGLLSGVCFGWALNAYRHATLVLEPRHPLFAAVATVTVCQAVQAGALTGLLMAWDRPALRSVFAAWRQSLSAGMFGAMASTGWLFALALAPAAPVRALGVIEAPMAAFAGRRLFKERLNLFQVLAGAVVLAGVLMTVLG